MKTKLLLFALMVSALTSLSWAGAPAVPTAIVITPGNNSLSVAFTAPAVPSPVISTYEYSTDGGASWRTRTDGGTTASPISITTISGVANTALVNGTSYNVQIRANNGETGTATATTASTPLWGDGTAGSPYIISTGVQYSAFRAALSTANAAGWPYVELSNDVSLAGITNYNLTISSFKGVFDGKGFKFTNVAVTHTNMNSISIFGSIVGATIKNLEVNVAFNISKLSTGGYCTGSGLVGNADLTCTIQNCKVTGAVYVTNTGAVTIPGGVRVGGIVGNCSATADVKIINCSTNLNLKATSTTTNTNPSYYGTPSCGGIIGSLSSGTKVYIINSSAAGSVYALSNNNAPNAGGIAAQGGAGSVDYQIINCLATNTVEGCNNSTTATTGCYVGGIVGYLTQDNAAAMVKNNIALNPSLKSILYNTTASTNLTLNRISPKTTNAVFTDNYSKSDMTLTANYNSNDGSNGTSILPLSAGTTTNGNGGDLGVDPTTEATTKLNTYVSANPTYSGNTLKTWYSTATNANLSSFPSNSATDLSVASGELNIDANTTLLSLTVAPGAKVTVTGTNTLTATNGITLQSSPTATATLVDNYSTPTITAKVQQHVNEGRNWYLSSPVLAADYTWLNRGTSVQEWNEATKGWVPVTSGTLVKGKGYVQVATSTPVITGTTGTVDVTGTTNSGDVAISVSRTESGSSRGFNLVGNPYPSYLKWTGVNGFLAEATNDSISTSFWFRTKNASEAYVFTTYNGSSHLVVGGSTVNSVLNEYIPPMQAFWIRVDANATVTTHNVNLTFKNNMRFHGVGDNNKFKAPKANDRQLLRLQLVNGMNTDEALIYFDANAANTFDNYDSPKMLNNSITVPDLYTKASTEKVVINGLNSATNNMVIPLGYNAGAAGNLTLRVSEMTNFDSNTRIYLRDEQGQSETEITPATEYVFNTAVTSGNESRFSLLFRAPSVATGIDNTAKLNAKVFVNVANQITIIAPEKSTYSIYNAMGQKQYENSIVSTKTIVNKTFVTGVYFVRLSVNGQSEIQKVIIR